MQINLAQNPTFCGGLDLLAQKTFACLNFFLRFETLARLEKYRQIELNQ